jgi:hypothetical protein
MITSKRIALIGSLSLAVIAAAARLDGATAATLAEEQRVADDCDAACEAQAIQTVAQLKRRASQSAVNEAAVRQTLLWISISTAVGGVVLLGYRVRSRRQEDTMRSQWSHALLTLSEHRERHVISISEHVARPLPNGKRSNRLRMPVVPTPGFSHQLKRAA